MKNAIYSIVSVALIWLIVCSIWPYWNRLRIASDLETVAIYGTKHSIEDTMKLLREKGKERGIDFEPKSIDIRKDKDNTISIRLKYQDKISFFSFILKELEFTLTVRKQETNAYY